MSKHKYTAPACIAIIIAMLIVAALFTAAAPGAALNSEPPYAKMLFSTDKVHSIDIVANESDWDGMIGNAAAEEYIPCSVVIDGEAVKNAAVRPKGNSSLSSIAMSDSDRYSFKIEFDHYVDGKTYYGLDKLALNNIAQDNTYMKDYASYQMMNAFGAYAPLSSFANITVNGEAWGLYLAVEGIEESFAERNYGSDYGQIYKPDNMDANAGDGAARRWENAGGGAAPNMPQFIQSGEIPEGFPGFGGDRGADRGQVGGDGGMGRFGSSSAASLVYTDGDPNSYSAIFDNAVFPAGTSDKNRLISALKQLGAKENIEQVVDVDEVMRYFVVHNFVLNSDSYTGSLIHNYYLRESGGKLSMIAWDYNLAFGGMGAIGRGAGGNAASAAVDSATALVNSPIDSPVSGGSESRPMVDWILADETCLAQYNALFSAFLTAYFDSGEFSKMYGNAIALISPYVQKDPTAFCSYEDFVKGQEALKEFCLLRAESAKKQLNGAIAATSEGQAASTSGFVDASAVSFESMGSSDMGFGRARNGAIGGQNDPFGETQAAGGAPSEESAEPPEGPMPPGAQNPAGGFGAQPPGAEDSQGGSSADQDASTANAGAAGGSANRQQWNQGGAGTENWGGMGQIAGPANNASQYMLLACSAMLLIGGLAFAKRFRA
jgi:hypothetical protein